MPSPRCRPTRPIVTHGHTFCTIEEFDQVAKAIGECAFVTYRTPVVLSLEVSDAELEFQGYMW